MLLKAELVYTFLSLTHDMQKPQNRTPTQLARTRLGEIFHSGDKERPELGEGLTALQLKHTVHWCDSGGSIRPGEADRELLLNGAIKSAFSGALLYELR